MPPSAAPAIALGAAIGLGLIWLFGGDDKPQTVTAAPGNEPPAPASHVSKPAAPATLTHRAVTPAPTPAVAMTAAPVMKPTPSAPSPAGTTKTPVANAAALFIRKLTADKLAAVFASGPLARRAAVAALVASGAKRSTAYSALRVDGPFAAHLKARPGGLLAWKA